MTQAPKQKDDEMDTLLLLAALATPAPSMHSSAFDAPTIRSAQIKAPSEGEQIATRKMIAANAPEDSGAKISYWVER